MTSADSNGSFTIASLTQEQVDKYCATSEQFWESYHRGLQAPFSPDNQFKDKTLDEWVAIVGNSPGALAGIKQLTGFPVLRGEAFIFFWAGHLLTNYRLQITIDGVMSNIPLYLVSHCGQEPDGGPFVLRYDAESGSKELRFVGTFIKPQLVNAVLDAKLFQELDHVQRFLLESSLYGIVTRRQDLAFPRIESPAPTHETPQYAQLSQSGAAKKSLRGVLIVAAIILLLGLIGAMFGDGQGASGGRLLQNGEIPGYSSCIEELATSCPRCPIKMCCVRVGGDNYKPGVFPTCEKYVR